jgi:hypothetical protein
MGLSYSELLGEFYGIENAQNLTYYIILSTDLTSWVRGSFPYAIDASVPVALTYGNGVFVICGYAFEYAGICLSSKDANNWETVIIFTASLGLPSLVFDGSAFYVGIANLTTEVFKINVKLIF